MMIVWDALRFSSSTNLLTSAIPCFPSNVMHRSRRRCLGHLIANVHPPFSDRRVSGYTRSSTSYSPHPLFLPLCYGHIPTAVTSFSPHRPRTTYIYPQLLAASFSFGYGLRIPAATCNLFMIYIYVLLSYLLRIYKSILLSRNLSAACRPNLQAQTLRPSRSPKSPVHLQ
ncbi:hypothetical protein C8R43DRAFT_680366 [Mycena crocata]|nr:hypothetical protein C8R43DRAFT_680366 [Mycena crocata]